ncbi:hypothetical protein QEN19_003406 [Hanseniaspora menglaensis]
MASRIKRVAFLSQLEDMEAYDAQYQDMRNKVDQNENNNKNSKYRNINNSNKNSYYTSNANMNQYKQPSSEYINNFLAPPNVSTGINSYPMGQQQQLINHHLGYENQKQHTYFSSNEDFSYYGASNQKPNHQMYIQQQQPLSPYEPVYMHQYPAFQQQHLYSEYYKTDSMNNTPGYATSNSTGSSNMQQITSPLSYNHTSNSSNSSHDHTTPETSNNIANTNSLINSYNKLWTNNSNSSVWS